MLNIENFFLDNFIFLYLEVKLELKKNNLNWRSSLVLLILANVDYMLFLYKVVFWKVYMFKYCCYFYFYINLCDYFF